MTLEEFKKLEQSATPGPWPISYSEGFEGDDGHAHAMGPDLITTKDDYLKQQSSVRSQIQRDAQFIAASRTMVPKLIKAVEYILTWPCTCDSQHEYTCERCEIDNCISGDKDGE